MDASNENPVLRMALRRRGWREFLGVDLTLLVALRLAGAVSFLLMFCCYVSEHFGRAILPAPIEQFRSLFTVGAILYLTSQMGPAVIDREIAFRRLQRTMDSLGDDVRAALIGREDLIETLVWQRGWRPLVGKGLGCLVFGWAGLVGSWSLGPWGLAYFGYYSRQRTAFLIATFVFSRLLVELFWGESVRLSAFARAHKVPPARRRLLGPAFRSLLVMLGIPLGLALAAFFVHVDPERLGLETFFRHQAQFMGRIPPSLLALTLGVAFGILQGSRLKRRAAVNRALLAERLSPLLLSRGEPCEERGPLEREWRARLRRGRRVAALAASAIAVIFASPALHLFHILGATLRGSVSPQTEHWDEVSLDLNELPIDIHQRHFLRRRMVTSLQVGASSDEAAFRDLLRIMGDSKVEQVLREPPSFAVLPPSLLVDVPSGFRKLTLELAPGPVDASALAGWTKLEQLVLSGFTEPFDATPLASMPRLTHLDLVGSIDPTPIMLSPSLHVLQLSGGRIPSNSLDLMPRALLFLHMSEMSLGSLRISKSKSLLTLSLRNCVDLREVNLEQVESLERIRIVGCASLERIVVRGCSALSWVVLEDLPALKKFVVRDAPRLQGLEVVRSNRNVDMLEVDSPAHPEFARLSPPPEIPPPWWIPPSTR